MKEASNLIDGDKSEISSQSIACADLGILDISVVGETFHIFDDKWTSDTQAEAVCYPCCNSMCTTQFFHISMIKGQLHITCRADCIFYSKLISIEFIRLHIFDIFDWWFWLFNLHSDLCESYGKNFFFHLANHHISQP